MTEIERPTPSPPTAAPDPIPPLPLTTGTGLALLGSALAALSTGFAWGASLAPVAFGPARGYLGSDIPLPSLINPVSTGVAPTVGLVVLVLAVLTASLVILSSVGAWTDVVRRLLGLVIVAVVALFAWRFHGATADTGRNLLVMLRAGAYLALIGGLLIAAFGPPVRESRTAPD